MARVWFGTSGYAYKEWQPAFYPADLSDKQFLNYYASQFDVVEIDSTFYRMPNLKTIETWKSHTPESFRFTLKASQKITHVDRLRLPSENLDYWLRTIPLLGERLALVLYQTGPDFLVDT